MADQVAPRLPARLPRAEVRGADTRGAGRAVGDRAAGGSDDRVRARAVHRAPARVRRAERPRGGHAPRSRRRPPAGRHRAVGTRRPPRVAGGTRRAVHGVAGAHARVPLLRKPPKGQRLPRLTRGDAGVRRAGAHADRRAAAARARNRPRGRALHAAAARGAAGTRDQPARRVRSDRPCRRRDAARHGARALPTARRARGGRARVAATRGALRLREDDAARAALTGHAAEPRGRVREGQPRRVVRLQPGPGVRARGRVRAVRRRERPAGVRVVLRRRRGDQLLRDDGCRPDAPGPRGRVAVLRALPAR